MRNAGSRARLWSWRLSVMVGLCLWAVAARAQDSSPKIGYLYPAGGQQGTTVELVVGGQHIHNVSEAYLSGQGVKAEILAAEEVPTGKEQQELRDELQKLRDEKKADPAVVKQIKEITHKLALYEKSRVTPAIGETVKVKITIAPDAVVGNREFRLHASNGISNPLVFQVGHLPEFRKPPPPVDDDYNRIRNSATNQLLRMPAGRIVSKPIPITLPTAINSQLMPGDIDHFQISAKKGQKIVVAVSARELIPYIADAVPGWVQIAVTMFDSKGREVVCADEWRITADPALLFNIPADGDYTVEIRDAINRGRDDFIYRARIGELPWVTGAFPLGGPPNTTVNVELQGWNLPTKTITMDTKGKKPGVYPLSLGVKDSREYNELHFEVGSLPEVNEKEPNYSMQNAQLVTLPTLINGRISQPGESDFYTFQGGATTIVAEVDARSLDSQLDSTLTLYDSNGKQIAYSDDHEDKALGLQTHHADSYIMHKLPVAGKYYLKITDLQQKGGPNHGYRLRISVPQPDFSLRVVPSAVNFRPNATQAVTVFVVRKDGFAGDIDLSLKDAPPGFFLSGGTIPANKDKIQCTLTAPAALSKSVVPLKIVGVSNFQKRTIERPAVSAEDMMQAFFYRHLVPTEELVAVITGKATVSGPARIVDATPVKFPTQGTVKVRVLTPGYTAGETGQMKLVDGPEGVTFKGPAWGKAGVELTFDVDPAKVKTGSRGVMLVTFTAREQRRVPLGCLPAIPYEVAGPVVEDPTKGQAAAPPGFDILRAGVAHGKVEQIEYQTKSGGEKFAAAVYLPATFNRDTKYPALYLLHSSGGDENYWTRILHADAILDNLIADKKVPPMIVVMPSSIPVKMRGQESAEKEAFTKMEAKFGDILAGDLIPYIEANYPVLPARINRAIAGYSQGANQAFAFGATQGSRYGYIGAFSGGNTKVLTANIVTNLRQSSSAPRTLWISVGENDAVAGKDVAALSRALSDYKVPHTFRSNPGGHDPKMWMSDLYFYVQTLFKTAPK